MEITLIGVLTASEWDKNDEIIGLSLNTENDEQYYIDNFYDMDDYEDFLDQKLEIFGTNPCM